MFWRKRKKSPAELANEAEVDKLVREAMLGEFDRGNTAGPPSGTSRGPWGVTVQGGGDLKLPGDKSYDRDAEPPTP